MRTVLEEGAASTSVAAGVSQCIPCLMEVGMSQDAAIVVSVILACAARLVAPMLAAHMKRRWGAKRGCDAG